MLNFHYLIEIFKIIFLYFFNWAFFWNSILILFLYSADSYGVLWTLACDIIDFSHSFFSQNYPSWWEVTRRSKWSYKGKKKKRRDLVITDSFFDQESNILMERVKPVLSLICIQASSVAFPWNNKLNFCTTLLGGIKTAIW